MKKNNKFLRGKISSVIFFASFIFVFGYLILSLIVPFLIYNQLNSWDLAGLYFSSWYQKEYLFPDVIGWNPYFFLGYTQNQFYPPLYSYLTAVLSFIIPLEWAFKLLFILTLVLMPISFYFFNRVFGFSKLKSAAGMSLMFSLLFLFPNEIFGGNMHASFRVGLIAHTLGIVLFFFYWIVLERNIGKNKHILASVLFAVIILTHIVAAFAASFLFLAYFLINLKNRKLKFFVLHGLLTFLLCAFWVVPFIGKISWMEAYKIGISPQILVFVLIAASYAAFLYFSKNKPYIPIVSFISILLIFSFLSLYSSNLPIHLYRFMMYLYLLLPFIVLSLFRKERILVYFIILIVSILIVFNSIDINARGPEFLRTEKISAGVDERVFVIASYSKESSPHHLQHSIPMQSRVIGVRGLYTESAKNARYIFDMENEIEPGDSVAWGTYIDQEFIQEDLAEELIPYQLKALGINKVVSSIYFDSWDRGKHITSYSRDYRHGLMNYSYYLYDFWNSSLIEVLDYKPELFSGSEDEWKAITTVWFLSDRVKDKVLVHADKIPDSIGDGSESVEVLEMSKRQDYIKFKVNSEENVPVLIKISEFPNWKAYQIEDNGRKEVRIYRASPYLMLVYGKGEIELKYERLFVDILGNFLSIIGLIWLAIALIKKY